MEKRFNILYWNIHYKDGNVYIWDGKKKKQCFVSKKMLDESSKTIVMELDKVLTKQSIECIIFTEAYPLNDDGSKLLYEYLDKKEYDVFPYEGWDIFAEKHKDRLELSHEIKDDKITPFKRIKKDGQSDYVNGAVIAVKKGLGFKISNYNISSPNFLSIENESISISGIRICFSAIKYIEQIEAIKNTFNNEKINILIGDFNPSQLKKSNFTYDTFVNDLQHILSLSGKNQFKVYKCDKGTNTGKNGKDKYPEYLCLKGCDKICFTRVKTAEEVYCDEKYICNKENCNNCDFNCECRLCFMEENCNASKNFGHIKKNLIKTGSLLPYIKLEYKGVITKIRYDNTGLDVTEPFPDHNLLFASIEIT